MKKTILAMTLAAAAVSGPALAADVARGPKPYYANAAASNTYNWSGGYAGVNLGYQWGSVTGTVIKPSGLQGGVQAGYNFQSSQLVFGAETDLQITNADDTFAPWKFSNPWFGTLRGRAGYAMDNVLFYGTAGIAYGDLKVMALGIDEDKTHFGWTAGLGAEYGISANWSAKAEYLYMSLSSRTYSITAMDNGFHANLFRLGINYHF